MTHHSAVTRRDAAIWGGAGSFVVVPLGGSGVWWRDAAVVPGRASVGVFVFLVSYTCRPIQAKGRSVGDLY